ncbi:MAG: hypothetical protein JSR33_03395 [Proteobacteria bacterium]|nr:hypothetical protein [Pseudomonadota bacterium]
MKAGTEQNLRNKILERIRSMSDMAILRSDLADLAPPRQLSRALKQLMNENILVRLGYGIYGRLFFSRYTNRYCLDGFILGVGREVLTKLNIPWLLAQCEEDYNNGRSQQVPVNPTTRVIGHFKRKIQYGDIQFRYQLERR